MKNTSISSTNSIGAYLALTLIFGKLVLTAPVYFLYKKCYDVFMEIQFLMEFEFVVNHSKKLHVLLGYRALLALAHVTVTKSLKKRLTCHLKYSMHILSLINHVIQTKIHLPPPSVMDGERMHVYPLASVMFPLKSQYTLSSRIHLTIPKDMSPPFSVQRTPRL